MGLAHVVVLAIALVTRLIVSIGRFVPSRPQWDECSISHFRESVNSGKVIAANTIENEGELNHHAVLPFRIVLFVFATRLFKMLYCKLLTKRYLSEYVGVYGYA